MTKRTKTEVMMMTTGKASMGIQPAASFHGRSMAEDTIETTVTCVMKSMPEMHTAESKAGAKIGSAKSKNSAMKGTMIIMVLIMTNLTKSGH
jgi:hypothetical protein